MTCIFKSTDVKRMLSDIFISLYLLNRRPKIEQSLKKTKEKIAIGSSYNKVSVIQSPTFFDFDVLSICRRLYSTVVTKAYTYPCEGLNATTC